MKKYILMFGLIGFSLINYAQESNIVLGVKNVIKSSILDTEKEVQIYLPDSYHTNATNNKYPVLYILNGKRWFFNGVNLEKTFSELNLTPNFIVVGVNANDIENPRERYSFFTQNAEKLADFLEDELIPYINNKYRVTEERMLFGWEYAGGFVIESLFKNPSLFNAYFSASPFPLAGERLKFIGNQINAQPNLSSFLYFANSINEGQVKDEAEKLNNLLKEKAPKSLRWIHQTIDDEPLTGVGHLTTTFSAMYHSLRTYYYNYGRLEFTSIKDFNTAGGLDYVKHYYKERADRYQLANDIPEEGMFSLIRMTLQENNFSIFDILMTDFIKRGFIEMVNPRTAAGYAQYYMRNNEFEGARGIYESLAKLNPNEPTPVNGLGHVYKALNNKKEAKKYYKKAIELAKKGNHPRLAQFEKDLINNKEK